MPAFVASDLVTRVRAAADMHDEFCTDAMILSWLDRERARYESAALRSGVADRWDVQIISVTSPFTTAALTGRAVLGVFEYQSGRYRRLSPVQTGGNWPNVEAGTAQRWQVVRATTGPVLYLYPQPTSGTYHVHFVPEWDRWASDPLVSVWYPNGHEEALVLGAAVSALAREGDRNPELERQRDAEWTRVEGDLQSERREGAAVRNVDDVWGIAAQDWTPVPELRYGDFIFL